MCGEADGLVANKSVFDKYVIPLPTDYESFVSARREFEKVGVRGFVADFEYDYSCMEALQGCAIPELMTMEGTMWRAEYESETADGQVGLDDKVWNKVFDKFEQYMKDTMIRPEDIEMSFDDMKSGLLEGRTAIM